jgi:hypothetical protein
MGAYTILRNAGMSPLRDWNVESLKPQREPPGGYIIVQLHEPRDFSEVILILLTMLEEGCVRSRSVQQCSEKVSWRTRLNIPYKPVPGRLKSLGR